MPDFQGYLFNDAGTAVNAASVAIFTRATAADETTAASLATATTTTNTAGLWTSSGVAEGTYDVRITSGSSVRWRRYQDSVQHTTMEAATLRIRTPNASFVYTFVVGNIAANYNITVPTITANDTLAVLGLAQTYTTARTVNVSSAAALAVGPNGNTNPMLRVVTNTVSAATGLAVTGAAAGSRVALAALSSGANEGLDLDALGTGTVRLGGTSTGNIVLNRACNVQGTWVADAAWTLPAVTLGGTVTLNGQTLSGTAAGTPTFSGTIAFTAASPFSVANGQTLTVSTTAQTVGAATLTVPNFAGVSDTFAFTTLAQTLSNKTLSAPVFSGAYSFGGTPTFGATMAGASTFSGAITLSAAGTALTVTNNAQIGSLGIGVAPSGTAGRLTVNETLIVSGTGPNAFGGATNANSQLSLLGTYSSATGLATGIYQTTTISGVANNTIIGAYLSPTLVEAASGDHSLEIGVRIEPTITAGLATATNAIALDVVGFTAATGTTNATCLRVGNPTGATNNYAINITSGNIQTAGGYTQTGATANTLSGATTFSASAMAVFVSAGTLQIGGASGTTANQFNTATQGAATTTMYIGNASINVTSDERVKIGLAPYLDNAGALLNKLQVQRWTGYVAGYAPIGGYEGHHVGFTAQDIYKVAPWAVNTQGDSGLPWQTRYEFLNGLMVKGWQEHDERLGRLEKENQALRMEVAGLRGR